MEKIRARRPPCTRPDPMTTPRSGALPGRARRRAAPRGRSLSIRTRRTPTCACSIRWRQSCGACCAWTARAIRTLRRRTGAARFCARTACVSCSARLASRACAARAGTFRAGRCCCATGRSRGYHPRARRPRGGCSRAPNRCALSPPRCRTTAMCPARGSGG